MSPVIRAGVRIDLTRARDVRHALDELRLLPERATVVVQVPKGMIPHCELAYIIAEANHLSAITFEGPDPVTITAWCSAAEGRSYWDGDVL